MKINFSFIQLFFIACLCFGFLPNVSFGQNKFDQVIDSILKQEISTKEKVDRLIKLAAQNRYATNSRKLISSALEISKSEEDDEMLANTFYALGNYYFFGGQNDSSLTALDNADEYVHNKDKMLRASILSTRGGVYSRSGDILLAIETQLEAKKILEDLRATKLDSAKSVRRRGKLMVLNNSLANLYLKTEDYELALTTYNETFDLAKKLNNLPNAAIILSNKGELLLRLGRNIEALKVSKEAKKMKEDAKLPTRFIALSNYNIGQAYKALDSTVQSLDYLNLALEQSTKTNYKRGKMVSLAARGLLYLEQQELNQAKEDCTTANKIAITINENEFKIKTCNCLYRVEKELGNTTASLGHFEKYTSLKDSIFNEKNVRNFTKVSMQYEFDKKEAEQQLILAEKTRQRNRIIAISAVLGFVALLIIFFYKKRLKYQSTIALQEQALKNQEIVKLQQENRLTAINSMVDGQEKERARIAKDLHDGLGGLLSSVKSHFLATQENKDKKTVEKTETLIDQACSEVRRISHNMMPHALVISGLEDGLKDIAERLEVANYEITLEINQIPKLDPTKEVMVYRLVQEFISNIKKHANASSIFIQLYAHDKTVYLMIEDNGKGFDISSLKNKKGLGLQSIESRVAYLNGSIDWDSKIGNGTTVNVSFEV